MEIKDCQDVVTPRLALSKGKRENNRLFFSHCRFHRLLCPVHLVVVIFVFVVNVVFVIVTVVVNVVFVVVFVVVVVVVMVVAEERTKDPAFSPLSQQTCRKEKG